MANVLMTLPEEMERTTPNKFAVIYKVDDEDCFDFAVGFRELGHNVFYVNWNDLRQGEFNRMFDSGQNIFVPPRRIDDMDLIFVYKMEGFLRRLPEFKVMVDRFEQSPAMVVNDPETIRHNIDKSYLWDLEQKGVRIIPTYQLNGNIDSLLQEHGRVVIKPRKGERGLDHILVSDPGDVAPVIGTEDRYIAQKFMPDIKNGEKSLVFLGFDFQHAVIKKSGPNEYKCNKTLGGSVQEYHPPQEELEFALHVLKAYASLGFPVHFSRIDIMNDEKGPVLMEAELLNPSIYANYIGRGREFGRNIAAYFDRVLHQQPVRP